MGTVTALPKRMSLASVSRGKIQQPVRVLLYGVEKIGKSSFASNAPSAIFLCAEDGTSQLDIARFPEPQGWPDVTDAIRTLSGEEHAYRTLVIDTVDWLEPMLWRYICERDLKQNIEAYGYGKGYTAALDEWRLFLASLDQLRRAKGMTIVLLGHATVKTFKNPEADDYDRFSLKLHDKAAGLIREWCDAVLFANYETHVLKEGARGKGLGGGSRFIYTERRAAWEAGNRFGLPPKIPLSWDEFYAGAALTTEEIAAKAEALRAEIAARRDQLDDPKISALTDAHVAKVGNNLTSLSELSNRLAAKIAEKERVSQ